MEKTTGIIVNLKKDEKLKELKNKKEIENYKDTLKKKKSREYSSN